MEIKMESTKIGVQIETEKVYPALEDLVVTPSEKEQYFKSKKYGFDDVVVKKVQGETLEITPSTEEQVYEGVFDKVIIRANDEDTSWINLDLADGVTADYHRIRKIGNRVDIQLYNVKGWTLGTAFTTIPEEYRPIITVRTIQPTTGTSFVRIEASRRGPVTVTNSSTSTYTAWVDVMINYLLD